MCGCTGRITFVALALNCRSLCATPGNRETESSGCATRLEQQSRTFIELSGHWTNVCHYAICVTYCHMRVSVSSIAEMAY
jgi:hypothetical protein